MAIWRPPKSSVSFIEITTKAELYRCHQSLLTKETAINFDAAKVKIWLFKYANG
jgi:hypothetical protein